jgi:uncharacterized tellurite resistance protein B-like protein
MSILTFLGLKPEASDSSKAQTETIRNIVLALEQLEPAKAKYIAAFAYLLSRVAHADLDISATETKAMERLVVEIGALTEQQAILVVQMAKTHSRLFSGTENYLVTREFDSMASYEQKIALLRCLFSVAASDEGISTPEDNEISQIATELHLDRPTFISIRAEFAQYLTVLKQPPV